MDATPRHQAHPGSSISDLPLAVSRTLSSASAVQESGTSEVILPWGTTCTSMTPMETPDLGATSRSSSTSQARRDQDRLESRLRRPRPWRACSPLTDAHRLTQGSRALAALAATQCAPVVAVLRRRHDRGIHALVVVRERPAATNEVSRSVSCRFGSVTQETPTCGAAPSKGRSRHLSLESPAFGRTAPHRIAVEALREEAGGICTRRFEQGAAVLELALRPGERS